MTTSADTNNPKASGPRSLACNGNETQISGFLCLLRRLKSPVVRDLAWVLFSPSLLRQNWLGYIDANEVFWSKSVKYGALHNWLLRLDELNTKHALSSLPSRRDILCGRATRLGLHFENLLAFASQRLHGSGLCAYDLLTRNTQIVSEGKTLGELDFIFHDEQNDPGSLFHVEAAVKFYLLPKKPAKGTVASHWLGPNTKDRLNLKLTHLYAKQLPFLKDNVDIQQIFFTNDSFSVAIDSKSPKDIKAGYIVKGMLFVHWSSDFSFPLEINSACLKGHWMYQSEFEQLVRNTHQGQGWFVALEKNQWLGGTDWGQIHIKQKLTPPLVYPIGLNNHHARQYPYNWEPPLMFSRLHHAMSENTKNSPLAQASIFPIAEPGISRWQESRLIVVPDYWPGEAVEQ